ncbi:growth/differentiation factor 8-like isoform X1 [Anneissia japonica]|uniref:growth/differentiation factor 8-like isoform X1 n=1 Tax=Anneissia japonica TaxID=1529436 RepID=UPI001425A61B|nr:growth/differentiation factor 8-like isoform X1 [Anneissia japonica]
MLFYLLLLIASPIPVEMASPRMLHNASKVQTTTIAASTNETTSTPVCSTCDMDRVKEWKIEMIKSSILEKLGLTHPPNVTLGQLPENPPFLEDLQHFADMEDDENMFADKPTEYTDVIGSETTASVKRVLIMATVPPEDIDVPNSACFNTELKGKSIEVASLWVYVDKATVVQRTVTHLRVYMLIEATPTSPMKKKLYKAKTISLSTAKGSWERFDASQLTREWTKDPSIAHRYIVLEAHDSAGNNLVITAPNDRHSPVFSVEFDKKRRHGRSHKRTQKCNTNSSVCCMEKLRIDFKKFGWDWVIAPSAFYANYCKGQCPISALLGSGTFELSMLNQESAIAQCCSPTELKPLKMVYTDRHNEFTFQEVSDMVVESCLCQ